MRKARGLTPRVVIVYDIELPTDEHQFNLFGTYRYEVIEVPWGGSSPRELTRAHEAFSVDAVPTGGLHAT